MSTSTTSKAFEEVDILVADLTIDERVQRAHFSNKRVNKIVSNFNADALGRATISARRDGSLIVLDGQHRIEALRRKSGGAGAMPCKVYHGLSLEEEARLFLDLNAGAMPTQYDRYRVSVVGADEETVGIDKIVHSYGLVVSKGQNTSPQRGTINAIVSLRKVYGLKVHEGEDTEEVVSILDWTLKAITQAWGNEPAGLISPILEGVGRLLYRFWSTVELDRLVKAMANYPGGATTLHAQARQLSNLNRLKVWQNIGQLLVNSYNKGLHTGSERMLSNFTNK